MSTDNNKSNTDTKTNIANYNRNANISNIISSNINKNNLNNDTKANTDLTKGPIIGSLSKEAMDKIKKDFIDVSIEPDEKKEFTSNMEDLKDKNKFPNRMSQKGFVNEHNGASIFIKENGLISLAAAKYAQYKISPSGISTETSFQSNTITNRKKVLTDEILVNDHKINPNFYEYTNFKEINLPTKSKAFVGNLTVEGSVLVKAWDIHLKRYMLIRRPYRGPLFHNLLNVPETNKGLNIDDPMVNHEEILAKSDKGYQVNALITDAKSIIGKAGFNRGDEYGAYGGDVGNGTGAGFSGAGSIPALGKNAMDPKLLYQTLKNMGYNDIAAAGIMGNFSQESRLNPGSINSKSGASGLAQWLNGRKDNLMAFARQKGMDWRDAGLQLMFMQKELQMDYYEYARPNNLNNSADPAKAAMVWVKWFEGAVGQNDEARVEFANGWYQKIQEWNKTGSQG